MKSSIFAMPPGPKKSKISLAVADPARECVSNDCKLDLVDIYGGLTAQKYTDDILGPHNEPHIDNYALADRVVFKAG